MKLFISILIMIFCTSKIFADANYFSDNEDSLLLYEIGGAKLIDVNLTTNDNSLNLGTTHGFNLGYSCGKFDISASFRNLMDNFKRGVDDAVNAVVTSANSAISSLPMLLLQRAQPGLYSMFKEYQISAENDIDIAEKSCQDFEAEIAAGGDPYAQFLEDSKLDFWQDEAESGSGDIVKTSKEAKERAGEHGIDSYGSQKGGDGQPPVEVVRNTTLAGYNHLINNNPSNPTTYASAPQNTKIGKTFTNNSIAAEWIIDVVGEYEINNQRPISQIGKGLQPKVEQEREQVVSEINNDNLDVLNDHVKRKIRTKPLNQQKIILTTIAHTEALKRTINKALIARSILLAGMQNNSDSSNNDLKLEKIEQLEKEINNLMFEFRVQKELTNETIITLLKEQPALNVTRPTNNDDVLFR